MRKKLTEWEIKGVWPNEPYLYESNQYKCLPGFTNWLSAKVPGSIHNDLLINGIIEDPYYEMNSLKCEWVENKWWIYRTNFLVKEANRNYQLVFKGIDYSAYIILNGRIIGEHEGMFVTYRVDINEYLNYESNNELLVVLKGIPFENSMYGYTSQTTTQKSRFNYKWDFSTRLVNISLYDDVLIEDYGSAYILHKYIKAIKIDDEWYVSCELELMVYRKTKVNFELKICGKNTEQDFILTCGINVITQMLKVENIELWWPNGHGEQKLYDVTAIVSDEYGKCDETNARVGFRTITYERTEGASEECMPFNVIINDKKIYLKGTNIVPLDHQYGLVTNERYKKLVKLANEAHINTIRVWGGGMIEKEAFYDWCDEYGIMVWQDFIQSSSSLEDVPSKIPEFLQLLEKTAIFAVKEKRNHVCLTYWCGGNELTDERYIKEERVERNSHPAKSTDKNISLLTAIVNKYDGQRMMLPTTASGPNMCLDFNIEGKAYDVHGPWRHLGIEDHYKLLNSSTSMLHSEMGTDGMSSVETLKKILSPQNIGIFTSQNNPVWRFHQDCWDTYSYRERNWFGEFNDKELEDLIKCSQVVQGEGVRYLIESNRRRAFKNCGSIIWQFNEPWPNICCTNIVEYFGKVKLAYYFIKTAYQKVLPSAKYKTIRYKKGEIFAPEIFLTNEDSSGEYEIKCEVINEAKKIVFERHLCGEIIGNTAKSCGNIELKADFDRHFVLKLTAKLNGKSYQNEYLMLMDVGLGKMDRNSVLEYYDQFIERQQALFNE